MKGISPQTSLALGVALMVAACAAPRTPSPAPTSRVSGANIPNVVVSNRGTEPVVILVRGDVGEARYLVAVRSAVTVRDPAVLGLVERVIAMHLDCRHYYNAISNKTDDWQVVLTDDGGDMPDDVPLPSAIPAPTAAACPKSK
jgi:hypothetical protein